MEAVQTYKTELDQGLKDEGVDPKKVNDEDRGVLLTLAGGLTIASGLAAYKAIRLGTGLLRSIIATNAALSSQLADLTTRIGGLEVSTAAAAAGALFANAAADAHERQRLLESKMNDVEFLRERARHHLQYEELHESLRGRMQRALYPGSPVVPIEELAAFDSVVRDRFNSLMEEGKIEVLPPLSIADRVPGGRAIWGVIRTLLGNNPVSSSDPGPGEGEIEMQPPPDEITRQEEVSAAIEEEIKIGGENPFFAESKEVSSVVVAGPALEAAPAVEVKWLSSLPNTFEQNENTLNNQINIVGFGIDLIGRGLDMLQEYNDEQAILQANAAQIVKFRTNIYHHPYIDLVDFLFAREQTERLILATDFVQNFYDTYSDGLFSNYLDFRFKTLRWRFSFRYDKSPEFIEGLLRKSQLDFMVVDQLAEMSAKYYPTYYQYLEQNYTFKEKIYVSQ